MNVDSVENQYFPDNDERMKYFEFEIFSDMCKLYICSCQKRIKRTTASALFFLVCPFGCTNSFSLKDLQTPNTLQFKLFKIESCSDSKVDEEGKEYSHGHHLLL